MVKKAFSFLLVLSLVYRNRSNTPDRRQSKTLILSMKVDQQLLEIELSIVICRPTGQMAIENSVSNDF